MDITKESSDFVRFVNNTVRHSFTAKRLADNSVHIEYNGEYPCDVVFVADHTHTVWVPDFCPIGMVQQPNTTYHKAALGYLFMHVGEYNAKMCKRLNK